MPQDQRPHVDRVITAYQATTFASTLAAPGDFASGTSSTSWTPVATAIAASTATGAPVLHKREVYGQIFSMLKQTEVVIRNNRTLSAAATDDSLRYARLLIDAYTPYVQTNAITV